MRKSESAPGYTIVSATPSFTFCLFFSKKFSSWRWPKLTDQKEKNPDYNNDLITVMVQNNRSWWNQKFVSGSEKGKAMRTVSTSRKGKRETVPSFNDNLDLRYVLHLARVVINHQRFLIWKLVDGIQGKLQCQNSPKCGCACRIDYSPSIVIVRIFWKKLFCNIKQYTSKFGELHSHFPHLICITCHWVMVLPKRCTIMETVINDSHESVLMLEEF